MAWPSREEALQLLQEYTTSSNLIAHALAVEAAMRGYARHFGENPDQWGVVGLLHDFDYEKYPDVKDHPYRGAEILGEYGYPEAMVTAILGHADYTGVARESLMSRALYAVDELTGLIVAVALVRPSRSLKDVKVKSVMKKWKDHAFARGVNRRDIERGAQELEVDLRTHVERVLSSLQEVAPDLGL